MNKKKPPRKKAKIKVVKSADLKNGTPEEIRSRAAALGRSSRGHKQKFSQLKQRVGKEAFTIIVDQFEDNVYEYICHDDFGIRYDATKAFMDFFKPKKKETNVKVKGNIYFDVNPKMIPKVKKKLEIK